MGNEKWWQQVFSPEELAVYAAYRRERRDVFDWDGSALLIVDFTLAFMGDRVDTLAAASKLRSACGMPAWDALEPASKVLGAFRAREYPVIFAQPRRHAEVHLGGATVGKASDDVPGVNEYPSELEPFTTEPVFNKARASAFFGTDLISFLVRTQIRAVAMVGGTTSGCIRSTAVDAASYGLQTCIIEDATFDRSALSKAVALHELDTKYAYVANSTECLADMTR